MPRRLICLTCTALAVLGSTALPARDATLHLAIGDPERRDRAAPVVLDAVTDTRTGELLTPADLPSRLADVDLLFVGESHTNADFHFVQLRAIQELHRAGRRVMIGLEMLPYTQQPYLDGWIAGHFTELGFLERADWYGSWGAHWLYYRDIFVFARDRGLAMFAVNTPREVVSAVRQKGFAGLTAEEAEHIPAQIDTDSAEYLELFKAYFDEDDPLHAQLDDDAWMGMLRAQCTWDATMGFNSVKALEGQAGGDGGKPILVVLIGTGHVAYDLGIARQSRQWLDGRMASLVPVPIRDDDGDPVESVTASYADFVWGLPEATDPLFPTLGLSTGEVEDDVHRKVIYIAESSVAEAAGFRVGDVLLAMDGVDLDDKGVLGRLTADKRWGDDARYTVRRGDATVELRAIFRRTVEEGGAADDAMDDAVGAGADDSAENGSDGGARHEE